jgi:formylglycine-generating enzyme required for sulfatase activity
MGSNEGDFGAQPHELPQHAVDPGEYWLARFPVTVAQFRAFIEDTGAAPASPDSLRAVANRAVVFVTWREAIRYCGWLTEKLRSWTAAPAPEASWLESTVLAGWEISLPSEAEWERAARGSDRRIYAWGDTYDQGRANTSEAGIAEASAVGAFPQDVSPVGALDMTGNVGEWTRSLRTIPYPYDPLDQAREDVHADDEIPRVARGGSFFLDQWYVRTANRDWLRADTPNFAIGFRLALIPPRG